MLLLGQFHALQELTLPKNEVNRLNNKKYRSHVMVIVKSIISILCIYLFMNAYFLIVALLHGARIGG